MGHVAIAALAQAQVANVMTLDRVLEERDVWVEVMDQRSRALASY